MGLEGFNYSADNEKTNSIEAKKSVDWKLVSENLALKTKLAASEVVNNNERAEQFAESVGLNETPKDIRNEAVETQLNAVVEATPSLKEKLLSFFSSGQKESKENFKKMDEIYQTPFDNRYYNV